MSRSTNEIDELIRRALGESDAEALSGFDSQSVAELLTESFRGRHRRLAIGGAAFLVLCDTAARTLLGGRELPVGALTALAGGPLFLFLLRRHHRRVFAP